MTDRIRPFSNGTQYGKWYKLQLPWAEKDGE